MPTVALEGVGATIEFATSGITADLVSVTLPETSRESIDTSHLGLTDYMTSKPAKLADPGEIQVVFDHDPDETRLILEDPETITINYPLRSGEATAAKIAFTGYATSEGGEEMAIGDRMRTSVTIKITGTITRTPAVASS